LNSHEVEYVVVGGHAVAFHGYPRLTVDLDFFVRPDADNARRLMAALQDFGFGGTGLDLAAFTSKDKIVQLGRPPNRIDLLTGISGVSFEEAWAGRVAGDLDGVPVPFLGRDALLANKRASARPKDLVDAAEIERRGQGSARP
jgi:hypothetical protein